MPDIIMNEENRPASPEDMDGINWDELNALAKESEEREKRLRQVYLDNPGRRSVPPFDLVELIWFHAVDYYGKGLNDEGVQDVLDILFDEPEVTNAIYDAVGEYAERIGWKMII